MSRDALVAPGVLEVRPVYGTGLGVLLRGPAVGWQRLHVTDWKGGVELEREAPEPDPDSPITSRIAAALKVSGEDTDYPDPGIAYHRVSDGFRICDTSQGIELEADAMALELLAAPDEIGAIAKAVAFDRLLGAVFGLDAATVGFVAERAFRERDATALEADLAAIAEAAVDDRALALDKAIAAAGDEDEVDVPYYGRAFRRLLPEHIVEGEDEDEDDDNAITLPPHAVWLVALDDDAEVPGQARFDGEEEAAAGDGGSDAGAEGDPLLPGGPFADNPIGLVLVIIAVLILIATLVSLG